MVMALNQHYDEIVKILLDAKASGVCVEGEFEDVWLGLGEMRAQDEWVGESVGT